MGSGRTSFLLSRASVTVLATAFSSAMVLTGCGGSNNSAKSTQPTTPTPSVSQPAPGGGSSSGGSGSSNSGNSGGSGSGGGMGSGGGTGSGTGSATSITGTVVNSQTNAPVNGTVAVALEGPTPSDYTIIAQTTADAQGHFRFDNASSSDGGWTIAVAAQSSDGTIFAPTLLFSGGSLADNDPGDKIEPGTDVGTITLMPSPTGKIRGDIFSQNSAGLPQNVKVTIDPLRTFTRDRHFSVPWLNGPPQSTTTAGDPGCGTQADSCSPFELTVPTANVWWALFNHNGNHFQSFSQPDDYSAIFSATSTTTGAPDCNPPSLEQFFAQFDSNNVSISPSQPHFQNCTP